MSVMKKISYALGAVLVVLGARLAALRRLRRDAVRAEDSARRDIVIRGGTLFDATSTETRANPGSCCATASSRASARECALRPMRSRSTRRGLAILPGFIDLHRHFFGSREDDGHRRDDLEHCAHDARRSAARAARGGRHIDPPARRPARRDPRGQTHARRARARRDRDCSPQGPIFTAPGGHPAYGGRDPNASGIGGLFTFQSDDPAAVRAEVAALAAQGVDGIKAVLHGNVSEDGQRVLPTLSDATFEALVAEAKAHDLWVAVHVGPAQQAGQAARAGVTTVEHGVRSGNASTKASARARRQ